MGKKKPITKCQRENEAGAGEGGEGESNKHKKTLRLMMSLQFQIPKYLEGKLLLGKKEKERKEYSQHNQQQGDEFTSDYKKSKS